MFSKLRRSKSEAAAHEPPKKHVLRGMPALKLLRKNKKTSDSTTDLSKPINTPLAPLSENERLGLPSKEAEMKYIGPKSHLEEESTSDKHNLNGNLNSRMSNTPTNMNNLRERHKVVVGKVGDINNIDRFKGMSFEQKESLMYYNEIISSKPDNKNIDNSYLSPTTKGVKTRPKKDTRKGHGLHSVKKRRRESREAYKDMIALTPKERESISYLDGILQMEEDSFTTVNVEENEDAVSQSSSTGSIIDMIGDLKRLTPSPNINQTEKTFALPETSKTTPAGETKTSAENLNIKKPKKHRKPDKEKRRKRSRERTDNKEGQPSESKEHRRRRKTDNDEKSTKTINKITEKETNKKNHDINREIITVKPTVSQQEISEITENLMSVNVGKNLEVLTIKPESKLTKHKEDSSPKEARKHRSKRRTEEHKKKSRNNEDGNRRRHRESKHKTQQHEDRESAPLNSISLDDNGNLRHGSKLTTQHIQPRQKTGEEERRKHKERSEKSKQKSRSENPESQTNSNKLFEIKPARRTNVDIILN